jgi:2-dehydropantoate 2-reductase
MGLGRQMAKIAVFGAGMIGSYVGGRLAASGADVTLIGRARGLDAIRAHELHVTDMYGADLHVPADRIGLREDAAALADADLILVTVKSLATEEAGAAIAQFAKPGTVVLSLQNGVSNAERLQAAAPAARVIAGMVPYNVAERGPGHVHQGTGGEIHAGDDAAFAPFHAAFEAAGMPLTLSSDMRGVLWGKLVINLNNAVNALSGKTLIGQMSQRGYRRAVALAQFEALSLLARAKIVPARVHQIPTRVFPWMMSLPDWAYRRLAARGAKIDKHARSSMADDLALGRPTEIAYINGEVVALAARLRRPAPINARIVELIHLAEAGAPPVGATDLLKQLTARP